MSRIGMDFDQQSVRAGCSSLQFSGAVREGEFFVKGDSVGVADPGAAEDVQSGADGEIQFAAADLFNPAEIFQRSGTAGVSGGDRYILTQKANQVGIYAPAETFDVGRVDEEFIAVLA